MLDPMNADYLTRKYRRAEVRHRTISVVGEVCNDSIYGVRSSYLVKK